MSSSPCCFRISSCNALGAFTDPSRRFGVEGFPGCDPFHNRVEVGQNLWVDASGFGFGGGYTVIVPRIAIVSSPGERPPRKQRSPRPGKATVAVAPEPRSPESPGNPRTLDQGRVAAARRLAMETEKDGQDFQRKSCPSLSPLLPVPFLLWSAYFFIPIRYKIIAVIAPPTPDTIIGKTILSQRGDTSGLGAALSKGSGSPGLEASFLPPL